MDTVARRKRLAFSPSSVPNTMESCTMSDAASVKPGVLPGLSSWILTRPWKSAILAGLGAMIAIAALAHANSASVVPLIIAPFGASCALVFGAPASPLARPRNVIGGHLVAGFCGLVAAALITDPPTAMAVGVGLAIAGMLLTETLHPPAGANPIVIVLGQAGWSFLLAPLLIGSIAIVLIGVLYHRLVTGQPYLGNRRNRLAA